MNHLSGPLLLSAFVFLAPVPALQAQTATVLSHTVIVAQPPDQPGGKRSRQNSAMSSRRMKQAPSFSST